MRFMNSPEALERLQKVRCFVLDMDGTFYLDTQIIPGSLEFYHAVLACFSPTILPTTLPIM